MLSYQLKILFAAFYCVCYTATVINARQVKPVLFKALFDEGVESMKLQYDTFDKVLKVYTIKELIGPDWQGREQHLHCFLAISRPEFFVEHSTERGKVERFLPKQPTISATQVPAVVVFCSDGLNVDRNPPSIEANYAGKHLSYTHCFRRPLVQPDFGLPKPAPTRNWHCVASSVDPTTLKSSAPLRPPTLEYPAWEMVEDDRHVLNFLTMGPDNLLVGKKLEVSALPMSDRTRCYLASMANMQFADIDSKTQLNLPSITFQLGFFFDAVAVFCLRTGQKIVNPSTPKYPPSIPAVGGAPDERFTICEAFVLAATESTSARAGWLCEPKFENVAIE